MERVRKVDKIKEDEKGGARDVLGVEEKRREFWWEEMREIAWKTSVQIGR